MRTRSVVFATLVLAGCVLHPHPPAPEPARGPARDSLFLLDQSRGDSVAARGAVDGGLSLLGADVAYLRAGVPAVYGKAAVRTLFAASPGGTAPGAAWQPISGGVSYDLRSAYTFGIAARMPSKPEGTPTPIRLERYIAFWQRAPGQPWRVVAYAEVNTPSFPEVPLPSDATTPPALRLPQRLAQAAASVRAADSLFADLGDRMGVAYAFSNTVTESGTVFGPSRIAVGPDAVHDLFASRAPGTSLSWRPVFASVAGSMDLGFTIGEYISTGRGPSGAAIQRFGKYLTVWEKGKEGWRFAVDGGNVTR